MESKSKQDARFFLGFGIPFLAVMTWSFGSASGLPRGIAPLLAVAAVLAFSLLCMVINALLRSGYSGLSRCVVPRDGGDVEIDLGKFDVSDNPNPGEALQACPWKLVIGNQRDQLTAMALQGVVVVRGSEGFVRLPLMLTGDFRGAARLLRGVAEVLEVPYLFHGDAEGWNQERRRAQCRPRLKAGGFQS
jgi:hypothetical protein